MNHAKKNRCLLFAGITLIFLLVFLRFGLYFLKSDGFSGLSMLLPVLLLCFILFALCTSAFFELIIQSGQAPIECHQEYSHSIHRSS